MNLPPIKRDKPAWGAPPPMFRLTVDFEREAALFRLPDGTPVFVHYSFAILALLITAPLWFEGRLSSLLLLLLLIAILFLSILTHELGHKAAARLQGARTTEISIGFFGGLAQLEWDDHRGIAMWPVALAGPVVNFGLAGIFFALYGMAMGAGAAEWPRFFEPFSLSAFVARTLWLGGVLNLWLALFNLLPAYPLDGGVIADDLLGVRLGIDRARRIVGLCGALISWVAVVAALIAALAGFPMFLPPIIAVHPALLPGKREA
jgi:Zn-dependent protease